MPDALFTFPPNAPSESSSQTISPNQTEAKPVAQAQTVTEPAVLKEAAKQPQETVETILFDTETQDNLDLGGPKAEPVVPPQIGDRVPTITPAGNTELLPKATPPPEVLTQAPGRPMIGVTPMAAQIESEFESGLKIKAASPTK